MTRHCVRRASSGCADVRGAGVVCGEVVARVVDWGLREERRVSGRPGAEGAVRVVVERVVRFVVLVGWEGVGMRRRDWKGVVSLGG